MKKEITIELILSVLAIFSSMWAIIYNIVVSNSIINKADPYILFLVYVQSIITLYILSLLYVIYIEGIRKTNLSIDKEKEARNCLIKTVVLSMWPSIIVVVFVLFFISSFLGTKLIGLELIFFILSIMVVIPTLWGSYTQKKVSNIQGISISHKIHLRLIAFYLAVVVIVSLPIISLLSANLTIFV